MTARLWTGIGELVTNDPGEHAYRRASRAGSAGAAEDLPRGHDELGVLHDAAIVVQDGRVVWLGAAAQAPTADVVSDLGGRAVIPGFVDSHSHLVFAGDRSAEFEARMAGARYTGGGIASTVEASRAAGDDALRARLAGLVAEMRSQGTTTVEVKSGYGLTVADEARMLRLAREVTTETTFLGAHCVPPEYAGDRAAYLDLVTGPMLRAAAPHARWVDVFCEPAAAGAFDEDESRAVLTAGMAVGLLPRVHGNQLAAGPGVRLAVEVGAASVDHCTHLTGADVDALAASGTVATLLPAVEFSTRSPYPDARRLIDAGVTVALATDCNPGSGYSSSMPFVMALAVREMRMSPAEALRAATAGGAAALLRPDVGVLRIGASADLAVVDGPSYTHIAYRPGVPLVRTLAIAGVPV